MEGTIQKYSSARGFGIIETATGTVFFHISQFKIKNQAPRPGLKVTFETEMSEKGLKAKNIQLAEKTNETSIQFGKVTISAESVKDFGIADANSNLSQMQLAKKIPDYYKRQKALNEREAKVREELRNIVQKQRQNVKKGRIKNDDFHTASMNRLQKELENIEADKRKLHESDNYLYVHTYEGSQYQFKESDCGFDIYRKLRELENLIH